MGFTLRARRGFSLIELMVVMSVISIIAAISIPGLVHSTRSANERSASATLRNVATMNADFKSNDRDGDSLNNFWTGDIAGLYAIDNPVGSDIALIGYDVAMADFVAAAGYGLPTSNKAGYWYSVLQTHDDGTTYDDGTGHHLSRFSMIAYPDLYMTSGNQAYITDEKNTIWQADSAANGVIDGGAQPAIVMPADPTASGWGTVD